MSTKITTSILILIVAVTLLIASIFVVDEKDQVIVTQLGKYVRTVTEPGLNFKIPLIQKAVKFEDRILEYDAAAAKVITSDKKQIMIDNYARWRISDPLKFYESVRNEFGAQQRLDDIVFSEIREELARHTFTEVVSVNRAVLMDKVSKECAKKAESYGIKVIDVRIKRADLPDEVEPSVFERMREERNRIATKYRSEGKAEATKIMSEADKEKTIILAKAYRKAEKLKGDGDAQAIKIYAEAYEQDPEFYSFTKTLNAYKKTLDKDTTLVLPSNSEFFKYLDSK